VILQHLLEFPAAAIAETIVATLDQQIIGREWHLVQAIAPAARLLDPCHTAMNSNEREERRLLEGQSLKAACVRPLAVTAQRVVAATALGFGSLVRLVEWTKPPTSGSRVSSSLPVASRKARAAAAALV